MQYFIKALPAIVLLAGSTALHAESGRSDYDLDDNGLIEINDLADLYASRSSDDGSSLYSSSEGCPADGCNGFELTADLDFDTNGDGQITSDDDYWNGGYGWYTSSVFTGIFEGNGHLIRNLFSGYGLGLFYKVSGGTVRNLGMDGPAMSISGDSYSGAIAGDITDATISSVFSTGSVSGGQRIGGLVGRAFGESYITNSFATGSITATTSRAGGLVGQGYNVTTISDSYATGYITSANIAGGIAGELNGSSVVTNTYWATDTTGQSDSYRSDASAGYLGATLAELQCPTAASDTNCVTGTTLYDGWSTDSWDFGTSSQMPGLIMNGVVYRDSDGDGAVDSYDDFADNDAASVDSDGDGLPDSYNSDCDTDCQEASGLTLDDDNDGDGVANEEDAFPQNAAASEDTDGDGEPDAFNSDCDTDCQEASGLTLDDDIDGDGVTNDEDSDNTADNGAPVMQSVPEDMSFPANSDDGTSALMSAEEAYNYFYSSLLAYDAADSSSDLTYKAYIDGALLTLNDDDMYELPVGVNNVEWTATDTSGNESEPMTQIIKIYPQLRFTETESLTGEPSNAQIAVSLTGVSPEYPVTIEYTIDTDNSTVTQDDIDSSFDITATHTVVIEADGNDNSDGENTSASITIPVLDDGTTEVDETLILTISGAVIDDGESNYFTVNANNSSHTLTITEANIAPQVSVDITQDGESVTSITPDSGDVTLTAVITDGNGNDTHTIAWDLDSLNVITTEDDTSVSFASDELEDGEYTISVTVTDDGNAPLSTTEELTLVVATPVEEESPGNSSGGGSSGGGSLAYLLLLTPLLLMRQRRR